MKKQEKTIVELITLPPAPDNGVRHNHYGLGREISKIKTFLEEIQTDLTTIKLLFGMKKFNIARRDVKRSQKLLEQSVRNYQKSVKLLTAIQPLR